MAAAAESLLYGLATGMAALSGSRAPKGATAFDEVARYKGIVLRRYRGKGQRRAGSPLVFLPPFMVRPYCYDLAPRHSFVRAMLQAGFDTYGLDFGDPTAKDRHLRIDDFVLDFIPHLVDAAAKNAGARAAALIGYSMGGIFSYLVAATSPEKVAALVAIGAPVDFHRMGIFSAAARFAGRPASPLLRLFGNIPGQLASVGFRVVTPLKSASRFASLFPRLADEEYVRRYVALNQWVNDFADWPEAAFRQFVNQFVGDNRLIRGRLRLGGTPVDLRRVTCPILAIAGRSDRIAPPTACRALLRCVSSKDALCVEVPGGHLGIVAAHSAPSRVWKRSAQWLSSRV